MPMRKIVTGHSARIASVLIVDDHPLYSDALAGALSMVFADCKVRKTHTLGEVLALIDNGFRPDLVMFDLKLPDVQGISGFSRLRDRLPDIPILVISSLTSVAVVQAIMKEGAAGFLPKGACAQDLREVLAEIGAGRKYIPAGYQTATQNQVLDKPANDFNARLASLTPQQRRIVKLICAGKPNKQIAFELSLAEATVKAHITALLRRLGVNNRTQVAVLIESAGVSHPGDTVEADARYFLAN